ncbi:ATP-binding protein [Dechloromonas sp. ZY10]|uniref:ATP-binding protein n=1 Tax=Dechloromonas aquae TaxID=2664436 RepID=UPI00352746DF
MKDTLNPALRALLAAAEDDRLGAADPALLAALTSRLVSSDVSQRIHFLYAFTGIVESDAGGTIRDANPAALSLTGKQRKQLLGTPLADLFTVSADKAERHFGLLVEQGISHAELQLENPLGEPLTVQIASIEAAAGRFVHFLDDVSEARRKTAELEAARAQADAANQAKSAFLANVSHEIRTPLNGILGLTQLVLLQTLPPTLRDTLEKIAGSGRHLLQLLNDLLDFAKIEAGKLEFEDREFDLWEVLETLATTCAHAAPEKTLRRRFLLGAGVPRQIRGDALRLQQILLNLLGNALKFTEQGEVALQIEATGENLLFTVSDSGPGIPAELQGRLFQAFVQGDAGTTRRYGGTGLGLSIAAGLAQGMGGQLQVASAPGCGSRFTLRLPLRALAAPPQPTRPCGPLDLREAGDSRELAGDLAARGLLTVDGGKNAILLVDREHRESLASWLARRPPQAAIVVAPAEVCAEFYGTGNAATEARIEFLPQPLAPLALLAACQRLSQGSGGPASLAEVPDEFHGALIAVVDDLEINRMVLSGLLRRAGIRVLCAENGAHLLAQLTGPDCELPELLLLDLHMPELDGFATAREIRRRGWTMPLVAISAAVGAEEQAECSAAGISDFLPKPVDVEALWGVLTCWLPPRSPGPASLEPPPATLPPAWLAAAGSAAEITWTRFLGDAASLQRAAAAFAKQQQPRFACLLANPDRNDPALPLAWQQLAHALAGGAANLGLDELQQAASRVEQVAGAGHLPALADLAVIGAALTRLEIALGGAEAVPAMPA